MRTTSVSINGAGGAGDFRLVPGEMGTIMARTFHLPTEGRQHMTWNGQKMRQWSRRGIVAATGIAVAGLIGGVLTAAQIPSQEKPLLAEEVFNNLHVLKGIPVDDFLQTMGIMAAALQFDCSD
ncbi:MAG: hypothetical protein DMG14_22870 [Acidobacteria bacterium]|nr:MAG: hypothetical protein DMG14_22870 [Acidobacteriota bacterium]